jgi:hypothetical protein
MTTTHTYYITHAVAAEAVVRAAQAEGATARIKITAIGYKVEVTR